MPSNQPITLYVNADTWSPEELTTTSVQMILNMGLEYEVFDHSTGQLLGRFVPDAETYKGYKFLPEYELQMLAQALKFKAERYLVKAMFPEA